MKRQGLAIAAAAAFVVLSGSTAIAQEREQRNEQREVGKFGDRDQQAARDWYREHRHHAPAGLRDEDRLSADEESRFHEGAVLDKDLRRKAHSAPHDLTGHLPPPAHNHHYVVIGGHVGLIDNKNRVQAIIHLHD